MQLRKTLLVGLVASVLLAGCSSEQDTIVMSPLPEVTSQFTLETVWDKSVGDGVGKYYSHLSWHGKDPVSMRLTAMAWSKPWIPIPVLKSGQ